MATFSVTTSPAQDAAVKHYTDKYNATTKETATPLEYARQRIDRLFDRLVDEYREDRAKAMDDTSAATATTYQQLTPTDKATVDAIYAKYS